MSRSLVVWFPDWPVGAAAHAAGTPVDAPVAVLDRGLVFACSAQARAHGVRRGQRVRDAQARCPELVVLRYDPAVDVRAFEPVLAAVERFAPGVEIIRPGSCAIGAHGPSRYFGGEQAMATALTAHLGSVLAAEPIADYLGRFHLGVADGIFAAVQAAQQSHRNGAPVQVIAPGGSAVFLAPLPISVIDRPELVDLLRRLGIRTLGGFAALPARAVGSRFGTDGTLAHRLAAGRENRLLATRRPPPELTVELMLEPPLDRIDAVAFTAAGAADTLITGLSARDLVCTCLRIEIRSEHGEEMSRAWRHPRWFTTADVLDRIRWQLQADGGTSVPATGRPAGLTGAVTGIRLIPEDAESLADHQDGLWGDRVPEERVHRVLTRVQGMLGHTAVVTSAPVGGRGYRDRLELVPWGDSPDEPTTGTGPGPARKRIVRRRIGEPSIASKIRAERPSWPGRLPSPAPAAVLTRPEPVRLLDASGWPVRVSDRQVLSGDPARLELAAEPGRSVGPSDHRTEPVRRWAGPWVTDERVWDPATARRSSRLQVVGDSGRAWLLTFEDDRWTVEADYD